MFGDEFAKQLAAFFRFVGGEECSNEVFAQGLGFRRRQSGPFERLSQ